MKYKVEPNILAANIGETVIEKNLVLLNLNISYSNQESAKINYDLVFRSRELNLGPVGRVYLGLTSCKFIVSFNNGIITDYTNGEPLDVQHTDIDEDTYKKTNALSPKLGLGKEVKVELGELKNEKQKGKQQKAILNFSEFPISTNFYRTRVEWEIDLPQVKMMVRGYLSGNFEFFVDVSKKEELLLGTITIKPKPFEIFDSNKKKIENLKSALANFVLHITDELPYNKRGLTIKFSEIK